MSWGLDHVTVRFGATTALDDVSLEIPLGQVTAVVGGDGAGKSTLAGLLVGTRVAASGTVRAPRGSALGFMPATSGVWRDLTVAENVELVAAAYGLTHDVADERAEQLLRGAGLLDARTRLGRKLSGGMRQKLGFCLAMLHEPGFVVLDEPSTGVDPVSRVELWHMVSRAAAAGTAVLVSTTYLDEAERAASVLVLDRGRALYCGDPTLISSAVRGTVSVGGVRGARGPSWRRGARFHHLVPPGEATPASVRVVVPDLEDAVIALTLERAIAGHGEPARATPASPSTLSSPANPSSTLGLSTLSGPTAARPAVRGASPLVVVSSVVKQYGAFRAVDGVSLTVAPGQVVGLLGANGAGKTTVIRTILGLEAPDGGEVRLFDGPPSRDARRRLGYVPQGLGLSVQLSVRENAEFVAAAYGLREVPELPDALAEVADRLVGAIGLGRQRQLAFWAALAHRPEVLVLDEPTSGVDPVARAALWDMVHAQAEAGVAVLVTTHYMQEAEQCDDLVMLSRGRRVASGSLPELLVRASAVEVRTDHWQEVFAALTDAGLPVTVAGRSVRVAGVAGVAGAAGGGADSVARRVEDVLATSGVSGQVLPVAATLEEVMVLVES